MQSPFGWRSKRRRSTDQIGPVTTDLGAGVRFEGTLLGEGNYRVQGEVFGDSDLEGCVILDEGACWTGLLSADQVQVAGRVEGNVQARVRIELLPTAVVTGNLSSPLIAIADGAVFEGLIQRPRGTQVKRYAERRGQKKALSA